MGFSGILRLLLEMSIGNSRGGQNLWEMTEVLKTWSDPKCLSRVVEMRPSSGALGISVRVQCPAALPSLRAAALGGNPDFLAQPSGSQQRAPLFPSVCACHFVRKRSSGWLWKRWRV